MEKAVLADLLDAETFSELYMRDSPLLFSSIKKTLEAELAALDHRKLLTLKLRKAGDIQRMLLPKPTREYTKSLLAFIANKPVDGFAIDSYLTPLITKVVEEQFIAFYSDEKRLKEVLAGVEKRLSEIQDEYEAHRLLYDNLDLQKIMELREQETQAGKTAKSVLGKLTSETMVSAFKQVAAILGKASYKAVILNMGKAIFSSGIVSFVKPIVLGALAKIGIAAIAKTAVAKALALIIGIGSVAVSIPAAYVLLPVVAAFLTYEVYTLPKKLAAKLPLEISRKLEADFTEVNQRITEELAGSFLAELEHYLHEQE
ncbi:hypothetical protein ACTL32_11360 [Planococcus sp. FY231025]|uniref:hypothetical protein n=1 Tax=Planococcus sp. FY231025 TaxID=3455699 RepID=UPI003F919717